MISRHRHHHHDDQYNNGVFYLFLGHIPKKKNTYNDKSNVPFFWINKSNVPYLEQTSNEYPKVFILENLTFIQDRKSVV